MDEDNFERPKLRLVSESETARPKSFTDDVNKLGISLSEPIGVRDLIKLSSYVLGRIKEELENAPK